MNKPVIIAICGKSASGKDNLARALYQWFYHRPVDEIPSVNKIVSDTTRPQRADEIDGRDYNFITKGDFQVNVYLDKYLEYTIFRHWNYGTPIDSIVDGPKAINIGVFDLQGISALRLFKDKYEIIPIYLIVNWKTRLIRSIKREHMLKPEMIRRLFADWKAFKHPYEILGSFNHLLCYTEKNTIAEIGRDILGKIQ